MEGIYVLQLTNGAIKVGRSSDLADRLRTHDGAFRVLDLPVVQVWSCPVADSVAAERRILSALERIAEPEQVRGREFFRLGFFEVTAIARDVCGHFPRPSEPISDPASWVAPPRYAVPAVLSHILEAFPEGATKVSSRQLVETLAQRPEYDGLDPLRLHQLIRPYKLRARQLGPTEGRANPQGYRLADVQAAIEDVVAAGGDAL